MSNLADLNTLEDAAEQLVAAALRAGADAADAVTERDISQSAHVLNGKVDDLTRSEGDGYGLRVFVGERSATISVNSLIGIEDIVARAVAMARLAPPDPHQRLADVDSLAKNWADLDLYDPSTPEADTLVDEARAIEDIARSVAGVTKSNGASSGYGAAGIALVTSHGFRGSYRVSSFGRSVSVVAGEGTAMERDYDGSYRRHRADLDPIEKTGQTAAERAVARLNPRQVKTMKGTVVLDRRVAASMIGHFAGAISGSAIARGTSFLKDKLGQQVFAKGLQLRDDPFVLRGQASRPFDGEGVLGAPLNLIEDGVLTTWLLDSATAHELGLNPNGRAARGLGSPGPSTTNIVMSSGDMSPQEMMAQIGTGLYVTDFIGHGVNGITGDYSRGASGFWIENGEKAYPVSEITIAGNLLDMFLHIVPANDLEFRSAYVAPTLAIEGLTIAGQ